MSTLRITVLAGGPSAERAVSLASGNAIAEALRSSGHEVRVADIAPDDLAALDLPADVIFPALHGTFGEDGQLQAELERRGLPFVGSDAKASATAIDKVETKQRAMRVGLRTPPFERIVDQPATVPPPCVVKPVREGSSVLLTLAETEAERDEGIARCVAVHGDALVEQRIFGHELTCGVLAGRALPVICIRPAGEAYDYEAKYESGTTEYCFGTTTMAQEDIVQRDSVHLANELGTRHLARVDWMLDKEGQPWLLEVNTLPGFTATSLLPKAAAKAGIPFADLCDKLARMPLET